MYVHVLKWLLCFLATWIIGCFIVVFCNYMEHVKTWNTAKLSKMFWIDVIVLDCWSWSFCFAIGCIINVLCYSYSLIFFHFLLSRLLNGEIDDENKAKKPIFCFWWLMCVYWFRNVLIAFFSSFSICGKSLRPLILVAKIGGEGLESGWMIGRSLQYVLITLTILER